MLNFESFTSLKASAPNSTVTSLIVSLTFWKYLSSSSLFKTLRILGFLKSLFFFDGFLALEELLKSVMLY